ncbi:hypothetical protein P171DRAFT_438813 [Karstenula rhodostoma CBS 690.94]|uniref:Uncharacterized protein n=1 Tax=Karstenula rhodostoma CBS 690.94 TaxID=1392251 RepID=A0A9P4PXT1_9PLEO|nr:hypothetical protein P171DRAFT_438813 [Karstenula rhodostoma CBS 690.94]
MKKVFRNLRPAALSKTRNRAGEAEQAPSKPQEKRVLCTPPPAYTESNSQGLTSKLQPDDTCRPPTPITKPTAATPYPLLTVLVEKQNNEERGQCNSLFRWSLVQIMADTFSANFFSLRAAVAKDMVQKKMCAWDRDPNSILSEQGQDGLDQLCALVRKLSADLQRNRWPAVCRWDKILLIQLVLKPAKRMNLPADYALEVLGRYSYSGEPGGAVKTTMLDHWTPSHVGMRPRYTSPMVDLGDTLASHAMLIETMELREDKMEVMDDAVATFRKDRGMERLQNSKELQEEALLWKRKVVGAAPLACLWPVSDEYYNLAKVLRESEDMHDDVADGQRNRLREQRKARRYFHVV